MRPRALHGGMHERSPEETGDHFCHQCGNTTIFIGYDDRGVPGPGGAGEFCECYAPPEDCECTIILRQEYAVGRDGRIEYEESTATGGGSREVEDADIGPYTRIQCAVCRHWIYADPEYMHLTKG